MYHRILVPIDGSRLSEFVLPHVECIARAFHAEVLLYHVVSGIENDAVSLTPSQLESRKDIAAYLERIAHVMELKQIQVQWRVTYGEPADEIVRHAVAEGVDLVMMSTHGQGKKQRADMGSVAMAVASSGAAPVMVVRPPPKLDCR